MIELDEEKHEYKVDGVRIPSVTELLKKYGFIDSRWYTEESRVRGTTVHTATELIDQGFTSEDFKGEYQGYIQAYELFLKESKCKVFPEWTEKKLYHEVLNYCGTIDRVIKMDKNYFLIDIKTGSKVFSHGLQLAAYSMAINREVDISESFCLHLKKDGKYKIEDRNNKLGKYGSSQYLNIWKNLCMTEIYRIKYGKL